MDRKARIVRFYLLLAAMLLLGLWEPAWWFGVGPIAFFWPGCPCCDACGCDRCLDSSTPCEFLITIENVTNGSCSTCTTANGAWVLSAQAETQTTPCFFVGTESICSSTGPNMAINHNGSGGRNLTVMLYTLAPPDGWSKTIAGADGTSCDAIDETLTSSAENLCELTAGTARVQSL